MKKYFFKMMLIVSLLLGGVIFIVACESLSENLGRESATVTVQATEEPAGNRNPISFQVVFSANGGAFEDGTGFYRTTETKGAKIAAPWSPIRYGYSFQGWAKDLEGEQLWDFSSDTVTKDITLYATWSEKTAAILSMEGASIQDNSIFLLVDNTVDSLSLAEKVIVGENCIWKLYYDKLGQMEIPTKIAAGTTGSLRYGDNLFYLVVSSPNDSQVGVYELNIHRQYEIDITFFNVDNSILKTQTVLSGRPIEEIGQEIIGYHISGWETADHMRWIFGADGICVFSSLSLYPIVSANSYTVTFDTVGGVGIPTDQEVLFNDIFTFPIPQKEHFIFLGWEYEGELITDEIGNGNNVWSVGTDVLVSARWLSELDFYFTCTYEGTYCTITGLKDQTLTHLTIPKEVTEIGDAAFQYCTQLKSVRFAEGSQLERIGNSAFECCSFTNIEIPVGVTSIGSRAFYGCDIENIGFAEGSQLERIGEEAFGYCTALTSISLPSNVAHIDHNAFFYCRRLVEIYNCSALTVTAGDTSNGSIAYYARNVYTPLFGESKLCRTDDYLFYADEEDAYLMNYFGNEAELMLPSDYKGRSYEIYGWAFSGKSNLKIVTISEGVTGIGSGAFAGCHHLVSITVPESMAKIEEDWVENCEKLVEVYNSSSLTIPQSKLFCHILNVYASVNTWDDITDFIDSYVRPSRTYRRRNALNCIVPQPKRNNGVLLYRG